MKKRRRSLGRPLLHARALCGRVITEHLADRRKSPVWSTEAMYLVGSTAPPPMNPKRRSTTPHRPLGGSPAAARREPSGRAAARRPLGGRYRHCTQPSVGSVRSKATSRRSSMVLRLTHGAAPGWACNRENMGERRTDAERPRPSASHD
jgi:hypothetical protein